MRRSPKSNAQSKPLSGVCAFVDARNSDGTVTSDTYAKALKSLGATVAKAFTPDECTHLVWSYGNEKQLKVAELYDIKAVTPLWVNHCQTHERHVSEGDFLVDLANPSEAPSAKRTMEPQENQAAQLRQPESPFFSSSQRTPEGGNKRKASRPKRALEAIEERQLEDRTDDNDAPLDDEKKPAASTTTSRARGASKAKAAKPAAAAAPAPAPEPEPASTKVAAALKGRGKRAAAAIDHDSEHEEQSDDLLEDKPIASSSSSATSSEQNKRSRNAVKAEPAPPQKAASKSVAQAKKGKKAVKRAPIIIAFSGFDGDDRAMFAPIIEQVNKTSGTRATLLEDCLSGGEYNDAACSHIVVPQGSNKRTLRILFALARGSFVLEESWLCASLEAADWVEEDDHLNERFETCRGGERPFANKKIMLAPVDDPDCDTMSELLSVAGAELSSLEDCDFVVGNGVPMAAWVNNKLAEGDDNFSRLHKARAVVNIKFVFDSLEAGQLIQDRAQYCFGATKAAKQKLSASANGAAAAAAAVAAPAPAPARGKKAVQVKKESKPSKKEVASRKEQPTPSPQSKASANSKRRVSDDMENEEQAPTTGLMSPQAKRQSRNSKRKQSPTPLAEVETNVIEAGSPKASKAQKTSVTAIHTPSPAKRRTIIPDDEDDENTQHSHQELNFELQVSQSPVW